MHKDKLCKQCPYTRGVAVENKQTRKDHRTLSLVSCLKNEEYLIKEWIPFHILAGVEHIYLYDDQSTDRSVELITPYVEAGFVTLIPWSQFINVEGYASPRQMLYAYAHAIATFGHLWRWMTFIDLDEFMFAHSGSLVDSLKDYEEFHSVVVPWNMFGHNGFKKRPDGLIIENFVERMRFPHDEDSFYKLNNWKSIVDPMAVKRVATPHVLKFKDTDIVGFNEKKEPVRNLKDRNFNYTPSIFQLNHYFSLSEEDFYTRRGSLDFYSAAGVMPNDCVKDDRIKMTELIEAHPKEKDYRAANLTSNVNALIARHFD